MRKRISFKKPDIQKLTYNKLIYGFYQLYKSNSCNLHNDNLVYIIDYFHQQELTGKINDCELYISMLTERGFQDSNDVIDFVIEDSNIISWAEC